MWALIFVIISGTAVAPATMPVVYETKEKCVEDAGRFVAFMADMPNELEPQWGGRRAIEWVCFKQN